VQAESVCNISNTFPPWGLATHYAMMTEDAIDHMAFSCGLPTAVGAGAGEERLTAHGSIQAQKQYTDSRLTCYPPKGSEQQPS
jgi:hypothetical protein